MAAEKEKGVDAAKSSTTVAENKSTSSSDVFLEDYTTVKPFGMGARVRQELQFVSMDKMKTISEVIDTSSSSKQVDKKQQVLDSLLNVPH